MCKFKTIALFLSAATGLASLPVHANVIGDQGFVKVFALKAHCTTKNVCWDAEIITAAQRALIEDPLSEFTFPQGNTGKQPRALEWILILPSRPHKEPDLDEGPVVY